MVKLDTVSFVEWDRRAAKTWADHAENVVSDEPSDWQSQVCLVPGDINQHNWRLSTGGARRGEGAGRARMVLITYAENKEEVFICKDGKMLEGRGSAFMTRGLRVCSTFTRHKSSLMLSRVNL